MSRGRREPLDSTPEFERLLEGATHRVRYVLRLYVTGATDRSSRAITNIRWFCERYLRGRYDLLVVDIYQQPSLARTHEIIAAPTLVKSEPLPSKRLVGDFSDHERLVAGLGIQKEPGGENT
ncbi:MAG: circadian clock KaiB family protein [Verrucomicrobia bacterium]|nr:circadian clock KaiB family protein [Verrucomicrobiota bacterium]